MPIIILIDKRKIGNLSILKKRSDLLRPIFCLAKAKSNYDLNPMIKTMLSKDISEVLVNTGFISSNPNVENLISNDTKLNWINWDYLKENDTEELTKIFKKFSN